MNVLYVDLDTTRPDHLSCYGYARPTTPHLDRVAAEGVRLVNCYTADAPCLPSRTTLFSGRFGIHHGAVNHNGHRAEPFSEGLNRGFRSPRSETTWTALMKAAGLHTVSFSSFAERHSAWHYTAGFDELHVIGGRGHETADTVVGPAVEWLQRRGRSGPWFMHLNLWDAHAPYRTPLSFGDPFADADLPVWYTEDLRRHHWEQPGMRSARDPMTMVNVDPKRYPRQVREIDSLEAARRLFAGYDTGLRFADEQVGRVFAQIKDLGLWDKTAILVSADHGETLGELGGYAGHHLADEATTHVPLLLRWPGVTDARRGTALGGLYYSVDAAATVLELAGGRVPEIWDGRSFAAALSDDGPARTGRPFLVISQLAQAVQRAVRFRNERGDWLAIHTYHDAFQDFPKTMLFDVDRDPHELQDRGPDEPDMAAEAERLLEMWREEMLARPGSQGDPLDEVLVEGTEMTTGPSVEQYLERLRATGRAERAAAIEARLNRR